MRICLASTTCLDEFSEKGVLWGDLTAKPEAKFRHAGFSVDEVGPIVPAELYAGHDDDGDERKETRKEN